MILFAGEQVLEVSFWCRLVANSSYWLVLGSVSCCFHNMSQISVEWGQIADALAWNLVWIYNRQGSDQEERRNSFKYGAYCASCVRQVVISAHPASQLHASLDQNQSLHVWKILHRDPLKVSSEDSHNRHVRGLAVEFTHFILGDRSSLQRGWSYCHHSWGC